MIDHEAKEFPGGHSERPLQRIQLHPVLSQDSKSVGKVCDVVYSGLQLDELVVNVDLHYLTDLFLEHHIDKTLIGCSGIFEYERHDLIADPAVRDEGSVFLIRYMHRDLVVSRIGVHEAYQYMP